VEVPKSTFVAVMMSTDLWSINVDPLYACAS
jgi:hypothetical protein